MRYSISQIKNDIGQYLFIFIKHNTKLNMTKYTCETCKSQYTKKIEYTKHIKECLKSDERSDTTVEDTDDTKNTLDDNKDYK